MTLLVDIGCPECGRKRSVSKRDLGRYYCKECDRVFTQTDVEPLPDLGRTPDSEADPDTES